LALSIAPSFLSYLLLFFLPTVSSFRCSAPLPLLPKRRRSKVAVRSR
jgi:hypothetical protein